MKKALIIDDDPVIRQIAAAWLVEAGYNVQTAPDGEAGLRLARGERPDVVVVDLMMPRLHGYSVCEAIRKDPDLQATRVVVASSKAYPVDIRKAEELGANAYLVKPFERDELMRAVENGEARAQANR